jgi:hypothetical protein
MKLPEGTGIVEPMIEKINCNQTDFNVGGCRTNMWNSQSRTNMWTSQSRTRIACDKYHVPY